MTRAPGVHSEHSCVVQRRAPWAHICFYCVLKRENSGPGNAVGGVRVLNLLAVFSRSSIGDTLREKSCLLHWSILVEFGNVKENEWAKFEILLTCFFPSENISGEPWTYVVLGCFH